MRFVQKGSDEETNCRLAVSLTTVQEDPLMHRERPRGVERRRRHLMEAKTYEWNKWLGSSRQR